MGGGELGGVSDADYHVRDADPYANVNTRDDLVWAQTTARIGDRERLRPEVAATPGDRALTPKAGRDGSARACQAPLLTGQGSPRRKG
jgi:hypothetical protein